MTRPRFHLTARDATGAELHALAVGKAAVTATFLRWGAMGFVPVRRRRVS